LVHFTVLRPFCLSVDPHLGTSLHHQGIIPVPYVRKEMKERRPHG